MTATSMARPRRKLQLLIETSPGRRRVLSVTPRIPSFSSSGARSPVSASLNTKFLKRLCLVILSPDLLQHTLGGPWFARKECTGQKKRTRVGRGDGQRQCVRFWGEGRRQFRPYMRDGRKARH